MLAARRGSRTLLVDIDGGGDLGHRFGVEPVRYQPTEVQPSLFAMAMNTEDSLREYLHSRLRLPAVVPLGPLGAVLDFVANAAPGVREILTVGKIAHDARERRWDLIVVDASATGHVVAHLAVPGAMAGLIPIGPILDDSAWIRDLLRDRTFTGAVIVSRPEEMAVEETIELAASLMAQSDVELAGVVMNRVLPELFSHAEETTFEALSAGSVRSVVEETVGGPIGPLVDAARLAVERRRSGAAQTARLRSALDAGVELTHVPEVWGEHVGLALTSRLADALDDEWG